MALKSGLQFVVAGVLAVAVAQPAFAARKRHAPQRVATAATAAVSGLAASHDLRREGNRLCFAG